MQTYLFGKTIRWKGHVRHLCGEGRLLNVRGRLSSICAHRSQRCWQWYLLEFHKSGTSKRECPAGQYRPSCALPDVSRAAAAAGPSAEANDKNLLTPRPAARGLLVLATTGSLFLLAELLSGAVFFYFPRPFCRQVARQRTMKALGRGQQESETAYVSISTVPP